MNAEQEIRAKLGDFAADQDLMRDVYMTDSQRAAYQRILSRALEQREGFVVVPREPTEAMLARFWNVATGQHPMDERHFGLTKRQLQRAKTAYWAMLTAAKEARDGRR